MDERLKGLKKGDTFTRDGFDTDPYRVVEVVEDGVLAYKAKTAGLVGTPVVWIFAGDIIPPPAPKAEPGVRYRPVFEDSPTARVRAVCGASVTFWSGTETVAFGTTTGRLGYCQFDFDFDPSKWERIS